MYITVSDIPKLPLCFVSRDTELDLLPFIKFKNCVLNQDLVGKIFCFKNHTIIFEGYKCKWLLY